MITTSCAATARRPDDADVGVVIPVYNRATILTETLSYVAAQTKPPVKVVIVDDGSTDGTPDEVEAWLARDRQPFAWSVIRAPHRTAAAARNTGLAEIASLPLVAFLDSDDHWPRDFLERASRVISTRPDAVAASADRRFLNADGKLEGEDDCSLLAAGPVTWMFANGAGIASCSLFRTKFIMQAGGWPEWLVTAEDLKLFADAASFGPWLHVTGEPVTFNHGTAAARGEDGNLSRRHSDSNLRWVEIYERTYADVIERDPTIDRKPLHKAIALIWGRAGKQMLRAGRADVARQCFARSIQWQPTLIRSWRRLAIAYLTPGKAA